jgi:hypothetical protein
VGTVKTTSVAFSGLDDPTFCGYALQGLADLAQREPHIRHGVVEILRQAAPSGTPAMKARSRKLLIQLDRV